MNICAPGNGFPSVSVTFPRMVPSVPAKTRDRMLIEKIKMIWCNFFMGYSFPKNLLEEQAVLFFVFQFFCLCGKDHYQIQQHALSHQTLLYFAGLPFCPNLPV